MPSQRNSVASSALWNHAGRLTDYVAWYCSSVLIARGLGVELNGVLAGMMSGVHLVLAVSSLGLEVAINKFIPQLPEESAASMSRAIVRRTASVRILLFVLAASLGLVVWLSVNGQPGEAAGSTLVVLFLYGLSRTLTPLAATVLIARWHADRAAVITGGTRLLELLAFVVLFNAGMSVLSVLVVLTGTLALQLLGYLVAAKQYWIGPQTAVPMRPIWIFGMIFWANTIVDYFLGRQGDILFLTLLSPTAGSAALYDVSYSILQAGSMVVTVGFSGVVLAAFARLALEQRTQMDRVYGSIVRISTFLVIPVLGLLMVVAVDLIRLLYSTAYAGAPAVLQVLLGFRIVARLFAGGENADYLLALEKVKDLVLIGVAGAAITVILHLILIPRFDAVGAAWAAGIGVLAANFLGRIRVRQLGTSRIEWRTWAIVTATTAAAGLVAYLSQSPGPPVIQLAVRGAAFVAVFATLSLVFHPLERNDVTAISSISPSLQKALSRIART